MENFIELFYQKIGQCRKKKTVKWGEGARKTIQMDTQRERG